MNDNPTERTDAPAPEPLPTHTECYGQPWAPSIDDDPAYKPDVERDAILERLDTGIIRVTYTD